jgi:hypothetical protein
MKIATHTTAVLQIRIWDPVPFLLTPGSGIGKKSGSGSGMNNPDNVFESLETNFWVKILEFFDTDPGWKISRIRNTARQGKELSAIFHPLGKKGTYVSKS